MSNNVDDINWEAFKLLPSLLNVLNDIRMTQTEEGRSPMAKNVLTHANLLFINFNRCPCLSIK